MKINPNNRSLKRLGRKAKLEGHSNKENKAVRKAIIDFIQEKRALFAQNRAGYGASLLKTWQTNAEKIDFAAEEIISRKPISVPKYSLLNIYLFHLIAIFSPLADNLTYEEEDMLREISERLRGAWKKFFGALRLVDANAVEDSINAEIAALQMQDFLENMFLGEVETELSDEYNVASAFLFKTLGVLIEGVK